jgi:uncharacterized SAM-binding protein YcdF (DUF218 family)
MIITAEILQWAQMLWDYHHMNHQLERSDCILVLGSHDLRVAERAASLYLQGMAPLVIMSGGLGRLTSSLWTKSEAAQFAERAISKGVPAEAILIEDKSANTGENINFTRALLAAHGKDPQSFILVQKPYMERRSYATFKKQWPGKKLLVTSPIVGMMEYPNKEIPIEKVIQIMVGDLQRIRIYPEMGFQIHQEIPEDVWDAFEKLVAAGFNQQLVQTTK